MKMSRALILYPKISTCCKEHASARNVLIAIYPIPRVALSNGMNHLLRRVCVLYSKYCCKVSLAIWRKISARDITIAQILSKLYQIPVKPDLCKDMRTILIVICHFPVRTT